MQKVKGKTGNERIAGANPVPAKKLFGNFIREGELVIIAAKSGVGKTILGMAIADTLSKGKPSILGCPNEASPLRTLYYDYELNKNQFKSRYYNYDWSNNIIFQTEEDLNDIVLTPEQVISDAFMFQADVIIIDNFSCMTQGKGNNTSVVFKILNSLKKLTQRGKTVIILFHTPKIKPNSILAQEDIAGSAMSVRMVDSAIFIAQSVKDKDTRYIKQVKSRSEEEYRILECEKVDQDGFLTFDFVGWNEDESEHLEKKQEYSNEAHEINWDVVFEEKDIMQTSEITDKLIELTGMSESGARNYIRRHLVKVPRKFGFYSRKQEDKVPVSSINPPVLPDRITSPLGKLWNKINGKA